VKGVGGRPPALTEDAQYMNVMAVGVKLHGIWNNSSGVPQSKTAHALPFSVQGNVAKLSIKWHVRTSSGLLGYDVKPKHRKLGEQVGFVMVLAL